MVAIHIPGYNYLGPGTPWSPEYEEKYPAVNQLDALARNHDRAYARIASQHDNWYFVYIHWLKEDEIFLNELQSMSLNPYYSDKIRKDAKFALRVMKKKRDWAVHYKQGAFLDFVDEQGRAAAYVSWQQAQLLQNGNGIVEDVAGKRGLELYFDKVRRSRSDKYNNSTTQPPEAHGDMEVEGTPIPEPVAPPPEEVDMDAIGHHHDWRYKPVYYFIENNVMTYVRDIYPIPMDAVITS